MSQATNTFTCFGGACTVLVDGTDRDRDDDAARAVSAATDQLLEWHAQFSRFKPTSELTSLNQDPGDRVGVTPIMAQFVQAALDVAELTGGLVDATLLDELERAGYVAEHLRASLALPLALALAPPREAAGPDPRARWRAVAVDHAACAVSRPPGLHFDGGGIVKGLFADLIGERLAGYEAFVVDCEGDMRLGGTAAMVRTIEVGAPFGGRTIHELAVGDGAVATATIAKRSWLDRGRPAHHLLDPATGRPAFTGVVQVTALAPSALEGEARAKAALLAGPDAAPGWLPHGGVVVFDNLSHAVIEPAV